MLQRGWRDGSAVKGTEYSSRVSCWSHRPSVHAVSVIPLEYEWPPCLCSQSIPSGREGHSRGKLRSVGRAFLLNAQPECRAPPLFLPAAALSPPKFQVCEMHKPLKPQGQLWLPSKQGHLSLQPQGQGLNSSTHRCSHGTHRVHTCRLTP